MITILEKIIVNNGKTGILVCDKFDIPEEDAKLVTNIGEFNSSEYYIEDPRACFSEPKVRNIIIRNNTNVGDIKEARFE